jgi:hypothetical protein
VRQNAEPVSRRDDSVPQHERVINDDDQKLVKLLGNGKEQKEKKIENGKRKNS